MLFVVKSRCHSGFNALKVSEREEKSNMPCERGAVSENNDNNGDGTSGYNQSDQLHLPVADGLPCIGRDVNQLISDSWEQTNAVSKNYISDCPVSLHISFKLSWHIKHTLSSFLWLTNFLRICNAVSSTRFHPR